MPPKGVSKAVSKRCPECKKQIPVATRHCQCGHQFFEERRRSTASNTSEQDETEETIPVTFPVPPDIPKPEGPVTSQPVVSTSSAGDGKRRSERVKREKPNFYDSLEYDNKMRKARKERQKEEQLHQQSSGRIKRERKVKHSSEPEDDDDEEPYREKRKKKKKKSSNGDRKEEEIDEDIMAGISADKEWQFSVVLSDINLKLGLNNPLFTGL